MDTFFEIGTIFNTGKYGQVMLVQSQPGQGQFIGLKDGNRVNTKLFDLEYAHPKTFYNNTDQGKHGLNGRSPDLRVLEPYIVDDNRYTGAPKPNQSPVIFRHVRAYDEHQTIDPKVGFTAAFKINYDTNMVECGIALCYDDNFEKEAGRIGASMALNDAKAGMYFTFPLINGTVEYGLVSMLMDHAIKSVDTRDPQFSVKQRQVAKRIIDIYGSYSKFLFS